MKRTFPAEPLSREEVAAMLKACSKRAATGIRNRALIVILWRGGLRIGEALALEPKDLDAERGTVRVLHGKGNKSRVVGLDGQAWEEIKRWLDTRAKLGYNGGLPVFCTLAGTRVSQSYIRAAIKRIARRAGIEKRVHAHGLRHTHASELREEGVEIGIISKQLGHSSIATTAHYLDHVAPQSVVDAMRGRAW